MVKPSVGAARLWTHSGLSEMILKPLLSDKAGSLPGTRTKDNYGAEIRSSGVRPLCFK